MDFSCLCMASLIQQNKMALFTVIQVTKNPYITSPWCFFRHSIGYYNIKKQHLPVGSKKILLLAVAIVAIVKAQKLMYLSRVRLGLDEGGRRGA